MSGVQFKANRLRRTREALQELRNTGDIRGFFGYARAGRPKKKKISMIAGASNIESTVRG